MAATNQSSQANRRASKRQTTRNSVKIEIRKGALGLGPNLTLQILDISEGGLRAVVKINLASKQETEVLMSGHGLAKAIKRQATVTWSVELESGEFAVGLRFEKVLPYRDVQTLSNP